MTTPWRPRRAHRSRRRATLLGAGLATAVLLAACSPAPPAAPAGTPTASAAPRPAAPAPAPDTSPAPQADPAQPAPPRLLLATEAESDGLAVVDPSIREGSAVVDRIVVGPAPWGVAVHAASGRAFVSTTQGVAVVDLAARERTDLIPYRDAPRDVRYGEYRPGGMGIAVSPDGARVHVAVHQGGSSTLETIDVATREVVASTPVGLRPFDVLVSADGAHAYTVDHDSFTVHVVDTATFEARRIDVAPFGTEGGLGSWEKPHYAALAPDGDLLLPYQGLMLVALDPDDGTWTSTPLTANSHQHGVALTPDGRVVAIGNGAFGTATGDPNLTILDPATGAEAVIPLDRRHETVTTWADPATGALQAVLSGGYTQAQSWDGATVVDLATHDTYEISIPGRPQVVVPLQEGPLP
ncbi:YncE family protein [Oerskovia turbata]